MGGAYCTYGRDEKCIQKFWLAKPAGDHLKDLGAYGKIILECIIEKWGWEVVVWIYLAQDKNHWWALVNTSLNLWVGREFLE
jgi:hypothetical protein